MSCHRLVQQAGFQATFLASRLTRQCAPGRWPGRQAPAIMQAFLQSLPHHTTGSTSASPLAEIAILWSFVIRVEPNSHNDSWSSSPVGMCSPAAGTSLLARPARRSAIRAPTPSTLQPSAHPPIHIFESRCQRHAALTIQRMKASDGTSIARAGIDLTAVGPLSHNSPHRAQWVSGGASTAWTSRLQATGRPTASTTCLACLRNATPANRLAAIDITGSHHQHRAVHRPGHHHWVASSQGTRTSTLLSTGESRSPAQGMGRWWRQLRARPYPSVMRSSILPTQCDKSTTPQLAERSRSTYRDWHAGLPLANHSPSVPTGPQRQLVAKRPAASRADVRCCGK